MMQTILTNALIFILLWVLKGFVNWGIERSKSTKNKVDDYVFAAFDIILSIFTNKRKKK